MCHHFRAASLVATSSESLGAATWKCKFPIWPEWNDAEVGKEKWDTSKGPEDGKTSKSPSGVNMEQKTYEIQTDHLSVCYTVQISFPQHSFPKSQLLLMLTLYCFFVH